LIIDLVGRFEFLRIVTGFGNGFLDGIGIGFLNCHVALARGLKEKIPVGFSQILLFFGVNIPLME